MTNEVTIFKNEQFGQVRTISKNGEILFCGKDVAMALGYKDSKNAIKLHCRPKGVAKHHLLTNGGKQSMSFIDEGNLYRLITHSKLPEAEKFESWVFDEVLPSIRKTGGYQKSDRIREQNTQIREQNAKIRTAQLLYKIADKTETKYKQVLHARITHLLTGEYLLPLPEVDERTLSAEEVGKRLGVSANRIGRIANAHGLKTATYGKWFYDKAKTADKQVETFRYFEKSVNVFQTFLNAEVAR